jgi:hypothetical protein
MAIDIAVTAEAESTIIEVEEITQAVDPAEAVMDVEGRVIQYHDREAGKIYKVKGTENPFAEKPTKPDPAPAESEPGEPANKLENKQENKPPEDEVEVEYANDAEYILRKSGYDKDEIDFGGDIGKIKIVDLTLEQQMIVIREEFDQTVEEYQQVIKELEENKPEFRFENPQHQQFVDYLNDGGDIKKLAKEILSRDPAAQAKMLSDDEIVKLGIKKEFPEFSSEEVEDEFKDMEKAGSIARRAKALRTRMEKSQPDFSDLSAEQRKAQETALEDQLATFKTESENIRKAARKLTEIAGIKLEEAHLNFLVNKVIPSRMEEDSDFIKGLENPEKLLRLQFYDTYGDKLSEYHYQRGLAEAQAKAKKGSIDESDLSDEPVRVYQGRTKSMKTQGKKSIDDFPSFESWVDAENKF